MRYYEYVFLALTCTASITPVVAQQPASIQPIVSEVEISRAGVTDVHLRPLFTTTIRLPDPVSSVAVGAPTLFEAEHSDGEPRLVYVKPSTKAPAESNLVTTMQSGTTISLHLISSGAAAGTKPVDFVVDYKPQQSLFVGSTDTAIKDAAPSRQVQTKPETSLDLALQQQSHLSTPSWQQSSTADEKSKQPNTPSMIGALGEISGLTRLIEYFISNGQAVG